MKPASAPLVALLNGGTFDRFDLYTLSLVDGTVLRIAAADFDIAFGGAIFTGAGVRLVGAGSRARWAIGFDVDTWTIAFAPRAVDDLAETAYPDTIDGVPWLQAARAGALDHAAVLIQRAYFGGTPGDLYGLADLFAQADVFDVEAQAVPAWPMPAAGAVPVGVVTRFKGNVGPVDIAGGAVTITARDCRQLLDVQMPRNLYQAGCRHTLFDARCGLSAAAFARTALVGAQTTRGVVRAGVAVPGGSKTYQLGRMVATSGANAGYARTIARWDGGQVFTLIAPFPYDFALGDAITLYPGCNKTLANCTAFNNKLNFGGDPFIPSPQTTGSGA